jgi:hypothetical protein
VFALVIGGSRGFSVAAMVLGGLSGQLIGARGTFVACGLLALSVVVLVLRSRRGLEATTRLPSERRPVGV